MKVSKWGNSLAIRVPSQQVEELGLKEGDDVEVTISLRNEALAAERKRKLEEMWARVDDLTKDIVWPKDYKFDRDEANSRG